MTSQPQIPEAGGRPGVPSVLAGALLAAAAVLAALLTAPPATAATADDPGAQTTTTDDAGSLTGTALDEEGLPVAAVVKVFPAETTTDDWGPPVLEVPVDGDGTWTIPVGGADDTWLPPGDYKIRIKPDGDYLPRWYTVEPPAGLTPEEASVVTAARGVDLGDLDVVLPPLEPPAVPREGELSGRVTDPAGAPVSGALVSLVPVTGPADADPVAATASAADGTWSIATADIPPGAYLVAVAGDPERYQARWFPDSPDAASAEPISVDGSTVRDDLDVVLPEVPQLGEIRGRVIAQRRPVADAVVTAYADSGPAQTTRTNQRGLYRLTGLPAGEYRVKATARQYSLPRRWYPDTRSSRTATALQVPAGSALRRTKIDMSYQPVHPGGPRVRARGPKLPTGLRKSPVDGFTRYQGQRKCIGRAQPGAASLYYLLKRTYGNITIGLNRRCLSDTSEHYDGRALDWMVNIRIKSQARKGDAFTKWLTKTRGLEVGAMARRLGVMYVIWRDRIWKQYQANKGWQKYRDCNTRAKQRWIHDRPCHRDHVHISMNWPGAKKQTSWWRASRSSR